MTKPTLTYFDIPTSRGEEIRIALHLAGVPFNDERLTRPQWEARKATSPFGAMPIYSVEGKPPLSQSNAILRMLGTQHHLLPADAWESARHEAVMCAVEEMRAKLGPTGRIKDANEKKLAREELANVFFKEWNAQIEKQILGPFVGGEVLSVADIKLFVALGPLMSGAIDHIPPSTFTAYPKLSALYAAVKAHPKVASWYAR